MSDPSDHSMDRPLREYARQRRETPGAPGDLHPAQRQVLLQQVKESYPRARTAQGPRKAWWAALGWPRWAMGGVAALILGLGIRWSLHEPTPSTPQMASLSTESLDRSSSELAASPPAVGVPPMADAVKPSSDLGLAMRAERRVSEAAAVPAKAMPPPPAPAPVVAAAAPASSAAPASEPVMLGKQVAVPASPSADALAVGQAGQVALHEDRVNQSRWILEFAQVPGTEALTDATSLAKSRSPELARRKRAEPATVLKSFRFTSQDGQLDLQDADGSIYKGSILPVSVAEQSIPQAGKPSSLASSVESLQGNALSSPATVAGLYRFQAQGSNRSLQQWVNVTGYLSNSVALSQAPAQAATRGFRQAGAPDPNPGVSWQIESRVQLGTQAPSALRARQVPTISSPASQAPR